MQQIDRVVLATQEVILDIADDKELTDKLEKEIGGDIHRWRSEPVMTYGQFIAACMITRVNAPQMFARTKEKLARAKSAELGGGDVDSEKSQIAPSGDVIMRWSSIMEAIARDTRKDVSVVRNLFIGTPQIVDKTTIEIKPAKTGQKAEEVLRKLLERALGEVNIVNNDAIVINFVSADA